jgi:hypothetical protein
LKALGVSSVKFSESGSITAIEFFDTPLPVSRETPVEEPLGLEDIESDLLLAELKRRNEKLLYHSS